MKTVLQLAMLSLFLLPACAGYGQKDPEPETKSDLIKTFCKSCPCESMDVDGEDVNATCYEPQPKERRNGRQI